MRTITNRGAVRPRGAAWLFPAVLLVTGCGDDLPRIDSAPELLRVSAFEDHAVFVDVGHDEARLVDVSGSAAPRRPTVVPLRKNALLGVPRRSTGPATEFLVLSGGSPDDDVRPALTVLGKGGEERVYDLGSAFTGIKQSDDGRHALVYFDPSVKRASDSLLSNANEIAIVDLDGEGVSAVRAETLRSLDGSSPRSVAFSPPMEIAGRVRRLAVILSGIEVSILDLDADHPEFTVQLPGRGGAEASLDQIVFSTEEPRLYLRALGTNDVSVITLLPKATDGTAPNGNDFVPNVSQIQLGTRPSALALFTVDGNERLLVAAPDVARALVVEPASTRVTEVTLEASGSQILRFDGPSPLDPELGPRALLYTPGVRAVTFLDLAEIEVGESTRAELLPLAGAFERLDSTGGNVAMLLGYAGGLDLLSLWDRTVARINGPALLDAIRDPASEKLWLAPPHQPRLGYLDLVTFHPDEMRLDQDIVDLVTVPSGEGGRVVVTHPSPLGHLTVVDATAPSLSSSFAMRGYLTSGLLDQGDDE